MDILSCFLKFDKDNGLSFGFKGVHINVQCSFYLLYNGKKIYVTGYSDAKEGLYNNDILSGSYQVVGFIRMNQGDSPLIIKSNIIILNKNLNEQNNAKVLKRSIRLKEWGVGMVKTFTPSDEYLLYRPELSKKAYKIVTNQNGFIINSQDHITRDSSILFMGASQVECLYLEEGQRITDIFQKNMHKFLPFTAVLNGGYSGATSLHILNTLLNKSTEENPKKIYCFLPTNDLFAFRNGGYRNNTRKFSTLIPSESVALKSEIEKQDWYAHLFEIYSLILKFSELNGCDIYFMTFPHIENMDYFYNKHTYSNDVCMKLVSDRKYLNNTFRQVIYDLGGKLIDLEVIINSQEKFFYDDVHFNEHGSNFIANLLVTKTFLER